VCVSVLSCMDSRDVVDAGRLVCSLWIHCTQNISISGTASGTHMMLATAHVSLLVDFYARAGLAGRSH
jgi:hypothetical protein